MNPTNLESSYFLVLHGVPPDWFPQTAFRKSKGFTAERQKAIKCPYCGKILTAVDPMTKIELYRYPRKSEVSCHEYRKCAACREVVGIIFAPT